jgi:hypothetical protein
MSARGSMTRSLGGDDMAEMAGTARHGKLLLILKVELGNGQTGAIEVRQGQSLQHLVLAFCHKHGLDVDAVAEPLVEHLEDNLRDILEAKKIGTSGDTSRHSSSSPAAPNKDDASHSSLSPQGSDARLRSAMDRKMMESYRRDLEKEHEPCVKESKLGPKREIASHSSLPPQGSDARPRSAMDRRMMEAYRRDLEEERERRMREFTAHRQEQDSQHANTSFWQRERTRPPTAWKASTASSSLMRVDMRQKPDTGASHRPGPDSGARPSSARVRCFISYELFYNNPVLMLGAV